MPGKFKCIIGSFIILIITVSYLMNFSMDRFNVRKYSNVESYKSVFLQEYPVGTTMNLVDDFFVKERGYKKSSPWYLASPYKEGNASKRIPVLTIGVSEIGFNITYLKLKKDDIPTKGQHFTLFFDKNGKLLDVKSIGVLEAKREKVSSMYLQRLFENELQGE